MRGTLNVSTTHCLLRLSCPSNSPFMLSGSLIARQTEIRWCSGFGDTVSPIAEAISNPFSIRGFHNCVSERIAALLASVSELKLAKSCQSLEMRDLMSHE